MPKYIVVNRDQPNQDVESFVEEEDWIELNGKRVHKPFVEKPVDGKFHPHLVPYGLLWHPLGNSTCFLLSWPLQFDSVCSTSFVHACLLLGLMEPL